MQLREIESAAKLPPISAARHPAILRLIWRKVSMNKTNLISTVIMMTMITMMIDILQWHILLANYCIQSRLEQHSSKSHQWRKFLIRIHSLIICCSILINFEKLPNVAARKNLFIYLQYQLCLLQSNFVKKSNSWFQNVKEKVWSQNYPQIKIFIQYLIGSAMREYPFILVILFLWSPMETVLKRKQTKLFIIYYCFFM